MPGVRRALRYFLQYWKPALGALLSLLLVNAANLATPQLLRLLIDDGITPMNMQAIWLVAGLLVVVALARGLFNFLQAYWSEVASQGVAYELRNVIFDRLQNLSFSYHDQAQTGKLMTRMTSDVEMTRTFVGNGFIQFLSGIVLLIGTLAILFRMNALLTGLFLLMVPAILLIFGIFVRRVMPLAKIVQEKLGGLNTILQENLAGIRIVKAFAREDYEEQRFRTQNQDYLTDNVTLVRLFSTFFPLVFLIANLAVVAVVWVGGLQVIGGDVTLGELVAFIAYQGFLLMPIFMLGFVGSALSRAEASAQRIFEVIDAESDVKEKPGAEPLPEIRGEVVFDHVSFRYAGAEQDVLYDVSFKAEPNQTVAIMGTTGSGKSSIINLIPRFYDVTEGRVLIDGYDVRDVTIESLRSQIGIVLQETTLFSGTVRENIAYGKPDASEEEVIAAAKAAQAHDFVSELTDGYDTVIGERGTGLSGGQRQRIAIARALILDPHILIMDDSTSAVDAETEYKIQQALENLRQNRTTFVIAQRISTVRSADLILLIDNGRLVEQGTHAELLECCELYAEILESQFGGQGDLVTPAEEVRQ
ncbi:MAG TPA: ABC transporter ATP-binding protein [Anaerolineaceae bacterium]|nr:ABC transporter ATP-binding protein [Anaerolineaceae bacterium]